MSTYLDKLTKASKERKRKEQYEEYLTTTEANTALAGKIFHDKNVDIQGKS